MQIVPLNTKMQLIKVIDNSPKYDKLRFIHILCSLGSELIPSNREKQGCNVLVLLL